MSKKITLSDGKSYFVGIKHSSHELERRFTQVYLKDLNGNLVNQAQSICSKDDNFSKREGRKRAAQRFIKYLSNKEDRRKIFQAICPEYQEGL